MRFIFHNPHHNFWFKKPSNYGLNRKCAQKYTYLFDYFLKENKNIYIYVDRYKDTSQSFVLQNYIPPIVGIYLWIIKNKINPLRVKIITNINKIQKTDVLFSFLFGNFTNPEGVLTNARKKSNELIGKSPVFKVLHLTHFMYSASLGSAASKQIKPDLFVAENNLFRNSSYFRKYFYWYCKDVYTLPFVPNDKFINTKNFYERQNKAMAMGTIAAPLDDKAFFCHFGHKIVQPMRVKIYENRECLLDIIDSFISPIIEINEVNGNAESGQKKYFSLDIVSLFNNYKMFVVPEEINDLPGISFVEGMMCGSAFIGLKDPMYEDIGLKDGINYIAYDGSLNDLVLKIKYYQNHQEDLEKIANNGYQLARNNFDKETVAINFINQIELLVLSRFASAS
jgi:glycosyltransferase involved in cell wall biosynthesis